MTQRIFDRTLTASRKIGIALAGSTIVAVGVVMLVLPGPAVIVIPLGLSVLAMEFAWAKRVLARLSREAQTTLERLRELRSS